MAKLRGALVMIVCYTGLALAIGVGWWLIRGAQQPWQPDFARGFGWGVGIAIGTWLTWSLHRRRALKRKGIEPEVFE